MINVVHGPYRKKVKKIFLQKKCTRAVIDVVHGPCSVRILNLVSLSGNSNTGRDQFCTRGVFDLTKPTMADPKIEFGSWFFGRILVGTFLP